MSLGSCSTFDLIYSWSGSNTGTAKPNSKRTKWNGKRWKDNNETKKKEPGGFIKCVFKRYYLVHNSVIRTMSRKSLAVFT